jgi:hypothetical protein
MEWGIFENLIGMRADVPHIRLPQALVADESSGFHFWRDAMRRVPGRTTALAGTKTPDGNPLIHFHYHKSLGGIDSLFGFTKAHAYLWNEATDAWDPYFTCSLDCTTWSTEDFGQYVVATNNLDLVQYWDDATPLTAFAPLGGALGICYDTVHYLTKAKIVIRHWQYLHLMNTTEDGTAYENLDRWCDAGDLSSWDETHAGGGDANFRELGPDDGIVGAGIYNVQGANQLIAFTQHTVNGASLVEDDLVYESHDLLSSIGCAGHESIVNGPDGNLYYMSIDDDGLKQIRKVYDPNPLSYDIQPLLDLMNPGLAPYIAAAYVSQFREIWWSVPSSGDSTANDLVFIYGLEAETWQPPLTADIQAFGYYTRQTVLYIDGVADMIDDVHDTIDNFAPGVGTPTPISSDADGYTWITASGVTDKGAAYSASLVLAATFGSTLNMYKRLHGAWLFFESYPGTTYTAVLSLRKGDEADYINLGTVSLAGNGKMVRQYLRFDKRLRDGHVKLVVSNPASFLGILFDFDEQGVRL